MHGRREYTPHFTIDTVESVDKNSSPTVRTSTDTATQHFRSSIETQPRQKSFSPESTPTLTYDYKSLPRFPDNDAVSSPSASLGRKIVTISRKEPHSQSSAFRSPQHWSSSSNITYNLHNPNDDNTYKRDSHSPADPVYKTTMITHVKSPEDHHHEGNKTVHRTLNEQQHFRNPQQPFIQFSVKPQQQNHQQYKIHYSPDSDKQQHSYSNSDLYSSNPPHLSSPLSNHSTTHLSNGPKDHQYVISNYKPTVADNHQSVGRPGNSSQPINQFKVINPSNTFRQIDDNNSNNNYYHVGFNNSSNNTSNINSIPNKLLSNTGNLHSTNYHNHYNNNSNIAKININNINNSSYISGNIQNNSIKNNSPYIIKSNTNNNIKNMNYNNSYNTNSNYSNIHPSNNNNSKSSLSKEDEVDELTNLLVENMRLSAQPDFYGMCVKCSRSIMGTTNGCTVLNNTYHLSCFLCSSCCISLVDHSFFSLDGESYCEPCYMKNLETCSICLQPIVDRLLRAVGKCYHVGCFKCCVCECSLDGGSFSVDEKGGVYCMKDYQSIFAIKCGGCKEAITCMPGEREVDNVSFLNTHYHVDCFKCQDCGSKLSSVCNGKGCFPMGATILCKSCFVRRKMGTKGSTEL